MHFAARTVTVSLLLPGALTGKALSYINKQYFSDANGNRGGAPNVAVVLVDGWPTDKVEEASRLARESGINIFFVTIEGPDENEKHNLVEANFVDKVVCFDICVLLKGFQAQAPCVFPPPGRVQDKRLLLPARVELVRSEEGGAAPGEEAVRHRPPGVQQNLPQRQRHRFCHRWLQQRGNRQLPHGAPVRGQRHP